MPEVCPLCGEHELSLRLFGPLTVAACPNLPRDTMRILPGPLVLESSRNQ